MLSPVLSADLQAHQVAGKAHAAHPSAVVVQEGHGRRRRVGWLPQHAHSAAQAAMRQDTVRACVFSCAADTGVLSHSSTLA